MAIQKPSIPKGTRDFSPAEMMRRTYIFETIKSVFRTYGFAPLETPAMENLSTLLGKYGDEGDKLLFKILNSGDYAAGLDDEQLRTASKICEKGLRYDLTVPFARYIVQHQSEIVLPFKRYQIQPVWRADRPQKGRYREFYQCDVDVIGSRSLINEVELIEIVERVFGKLGINVTLKMNNRKILYGIAEAIGHADKMMDITVAIDKLEGQMRKLKTRMDRTKEADSLGKALAFENFAEELATEKITGQLYTLGVPYERERIESSVYAMATEPIAYSLLALDKLRGKADMLIAQKEQNPFSGKNVRTAFKQRFDTAERLLQFLVPNYAHRLPAYNNE